MLTPIKRALPRGVVKVLKRALGLRMHTTEEAGEKGSDFYDRTLEEDDSWRGHYTESPYYFLWTVLIDRLRRSDVSSILEIGCGSGQLASAICDAGIVERYLGFDFSESRIQAAKTACPPFEFQVADAHKTDLLSTVDYDVAIATEFLEHVEADLEILRRLRSKTVFIGTVPNFPFVSHVRHFEGIRSVEMRYREIFDELSVVKIAANDRGKTFFVMEGVTKANM